MNLPLLKNADISGKRVFLRLDLDVPLRKLKVQSEKFKVEIEDDTRPAAAIPTIEYLLKNNAKVIVAGHLGRPKGVDKTLSLEPIAKWFFKEFEIRNLKFEFKLKIENFKFTKLNGFDGWEIGPKIFLLENLRFDAGEETNDPEFAAKLASLAEVYINDAFAMCHRSHASIVGITKFLPHFAGFHLEKEINVLSKVLQNPRRPLVVLIGGKKVETKLPLVEKMHYLADYVLVGGKIAGESKILVKEQHRKITAQKAVLLVADATSDGLDITDKSAENFLQIINIAKTVIWNGSMGVIGTKAQNLPSEKGTRKIAEAIIANKAYSVVGGGDTVEFLNKSGILGKFSFASTGGGAMLAFLAGEKLPGIEALTL